MYPSVGRRDADGARLIPELRDLLVDTCMSARNICSDDKTKRTPCAFVRKYNYSSFAEPSQLNEVLRAHHITDVYLCGINTDYCVFATALDGFYASYNVLVVEEGVSSVCGAAGHRQGLDQIDKFGCANVVSAEDILCNNTS